MAGLLHHKPGCSDWMANLLDRRDGSGPKPTALHNGSVHPPHAVQLNPCSDPCVEKTSGFKSPDRGLDSLYCRATTTEQVEASEQSFGQASPLGRRHFASPGAAMGQNDWDPASHGKLVQENPFGLTEGGLLHPVKVGPDKAQTRHAEFEVFG